MAKEKQQKKKYQVQKLDFPAVIQGISVSTNMIIELEETDEVKSLIEMQILKEVNENG